jgi:hypothetical protein
MSFHPRDLLAMGDTLAQTTGLPSQAKLQHQFLEEALPQATPDFVWKTTMNGQSCELTLAECRDYYKELCERLELKPKATCLTTQENAE